MKNTLLRVLSAVLLVASATSKSEDAAPCKHPFFPLSSGCYYFSGNDNLLTNWFRASELCRRFGGHLLTVDDPVEGADVKQYLQNQQVQGLVYLGAHALGDLQTFYWQSNLAPLAYSDWLPGEPRETSKYPCMAMYSVNKFQWGASICNKNYTFFCEAL